MQSASVFLLFVKDLLHDSLLASFTDFLEAVPEYLGYIFVQKKNKQFFK